MGLLIKDILKIGETRLERAGIFNFKTDAAELFCYLYNIERNNQPAGVFPAGCAVDRAKQRMMLLLHLFVWRSEAADNIVRQK